VSYSRSPMMSLLLFDPIDPFGAHSELPGRKCSVWGSGNKEALLYLNNGRANGVLACLCIPCRIGRCTLHGLLPMGTWNGRPFGWKPPFDEEFA
jgi:hypothetical protein